MRLCKHARYKLITHIKDPKWMTNELLVNTALIDPNVEHYIFQFANDKPIPNFSSISARDKYGWFYCNGSVLRRHRKQKNGRGEVYVLPMSKTEPFEPIKNCEHEVF